MNVPLFLFGNGLSIALSPVFSLKHITENFIAGLEGDEKEFLTTICGGEDSINFDDFEVNFSRLEDAYNSLVKYDEFIKTEVGQTFLNNFNSKTPS